MNSPERNEFGDWLQQELGSRGWSYPQFARLARVSDASVKRWIRGERNISERSSDAVADALGASRNFVRDLAGLPPTDDDPIVDIQQGDADRNLPLLSKEQIEALEAFLAFQRSLHGDT